MREIYSKTHHLITTIRHFSWYSVLAIVFIVQVSGNKLAQAQDLEQMAKLISANRGFVSSASRTTLDYYGASVAVSGDYAVVGAYGEAEDVNGEDTKTNAGSAFIYKKEGNTWKFHQKIVASNRTASNQFGCAVDIDGDYIIIGAKQRTQTSSTTGNSTYAGAAYIFKLNNGVWEEQQEIMASYRGAGTTYRDALFGSTVVIRDGYAVVGAPQESIPDNNNARVQYVGAAYIFKLNGSTWSEIKRLQSPLIGVQNKFGSSVAINNNYLFVGEVGISGSKGSTHVYKFENNDWVYSEKLAASDETNNNSFGYAIATNNNYTVISATGWKHTDDKSYGAAYVFKLNTSNGKWEEKGVLPGTIGTFGAGYGNKLAIGNSHIAIGSSLSKDDTPTLQHGVTYIYKFDDDSYSLQKLIAPDRSEDSETGGRFGAALAIDGSNLFIGADTEGNNENGTAYMDRAGAVYTFSFDGTQWASSQKMVAIDKATKNFFGYSVATSGDYTVIGAPQENVFDASGQNALGTAGRVYIFKRNVAGVWELQQELLASDRTSGDNFGQAVSIKGEYLIIGADKASVTSGTETLSKAGKAYIYQLEGNTWVEKGKFTAETPQANANFGSAVSITQGYAVVGSYLDGNGAAYVLKNNSGTWAFQQKITASEQATQAYFGASVAIDGTSILVGSPRLTVSGVTGVSGVQHGKAFLFSLDEITGNWQETTKLNIPTMVAKDQFGISVALKGDYAIVGAHQRAPIAPSGTGTLGTAGAAYLFKNNAGTWSFLQELVADDRAASDLFGYSVSINNNYAIVGAYQQDATSSVSNNAGAAYLYKKALNSNNEEVWSQYQKITADERGAGDLFGFSVAIDDYVIAGAYVHNKDLNNQNPVTGAGAAYIFGIPGQTLPVVLKDYTAKAEGAYAKLQWQTTEEINNKKFVIYRSTDNQSFEKITEVVPTNSSSSGNNYSYYDRSPLSGNNYYKLAQVDANGKETELGIRHLSFDITTPVSATVYPNPTTDKVTLTFEEGKYRQLIVSDLNGRSLQHINIPVRANTLDISVENYATGLYLLKLVGDTDTAIKKIIKK